MLELHECSRAERDFASVVRALSSEAGVTKGRMFGSEGLKVGKQVFAMEVKGKLVVKVSAERASDAGPLSCSPEAILRRPA